MNKLIIVIFILVITTGISFARGYDFNLPLPGESIANDKLQFNVVKELYEITSKKYPACLNYNISNTQIIHYPHDVVKKKGKYVSGYWRELWSVKACDSVYQVPVTFTIHKKKTTYHIDL